MVRLIKFEHQAIGNVNRYLIEPYLKEVWKKRFAQLEEEDNQNDFQGILSFDANHAKARNYIGFIQCDDEQVEIYPKVFKNCPVNQNNLNLFTRHIFFWLDYCRKWRFPFTKNKLNQEQDFDLPELIIHIMAQHLLRVLNDSPISLYEEMEESVTVVRGRINFARYITNGLSSGNNHLIECDVEPLVYDNILNRVIKHVARQLLTRARFSETRQTLDEIIFILSEVEDINCTSKDLDTIQLNSFYSDYHEVIDICRLVLDQLYYNSQTSEQMQWCLLFPMEYIFEDFVAGFIESNFQNEWIITPQKSELALTDEGVFMMRHDIFLENRADPSIRIIIDTKYKLRTAADRNQPKKGIAQNDLYQITSYAFRRGCHAVILFYPNVSEGLQEPDMFTISSGFDNKDTVQVIGAEVPFWSITDLQLLPAVLKIQLTKLLALVKPPRSSTSASQGST